MRALVCSISLMFLVTACSTAPQRPASSAGSNRVVRTAESLIGTPYHYGGDSPRTGFDCSGFVRYVYYRASGISLPHSTSLLSRRGRWVRSGDLHPGDLVFYNTLGRPYSHVGIYIGHRQFIHSPHTGSSVETVDMDMSYWRERYDGARRVVKEYR